MPLATPNIEVLEGETPAGLPANSVLNVWDSCNFLAAGFTDPKVRSVDVRQADTNTGTVLIGYRTSNPLHPGAYNYPPIEGRWYDLRNVVVKLGAEGDRVIVGAVR